MGLLSAGVRSLLWVFEEIADRVENERFDEDAVKAELTDLYMKLESGAISEDQFERHEAELVQQLQEIEQHNQHKQQRSVRGAR